MFLIKDTPPGGVAICYIRTISKMLKDITVISYYPDQITTELKTKQGKEILIKKEVNVFCLATTCSDYFNEIERKTFNLVEILVSDNIWQNNGFGKTVSFVFRSKEEEEKFLTNNTVIEQNNFYIDATDILKEKLSKNT